MYPIIGNTHLDVREKSSKPLRFNSGKNLRNGIFGGYLGPGRSLGPSCTPEWPPQLQTDILHALVYTFHFFKLFF